jgi:hypothetical protein
VKTDHGHPTKGIYRHAGQGTAILYDQPVPLSKLSIANIQFGRRITEAISKCYKNWLAEVKNVTVDPHYRIPQLNSSECFVRSNVGLGKLISEGSRYRRTTHGVP